MCTTGSAVSFKNPDPDPDTDAFAVAANYIAVTPIHYDLTHYPMLEALRGWPLDFENPDEDLLGAAPPRRPGPRFLTILCLPCRFGLCYKSVLPTNVRP